MNVVWTDRAKQRLWELHDYIAHEAPMVAPQIVRRLLLRSLQTTGRATCRTARTRVRKPYFPVRNPALKARAVSDTSGMILEYAMRVGPITASTPATSPSTKYGAVTRLQSSSTL
jgi:hypothetical protein